MYESDRFATIHLSLLLQAIFSNALDLKLSKLDKRARYSDRGRFDRSTPAVLNLF